MAVSRFRLFGTALLNGLLIGIFFILPLYLIVYGWDFTIGSDAFFSDVLGHNQQLYSFLSVIYVAQVLAAAMLLSVIAGLLTALVSGDEARTVSGAVKLGVPTGIGLSALISLCACSIIAILSGRFTPGYSGLADFSVSFLQFLLPLLVFLVPSSAAGVYYCANSVVVDLKSQWISGPANFILLLAFLILTIAIVPQIVMLLSLHVM